MKLLYILFTYVILVRLPTNFKSLSFTVGCEICPFFNPRGQKWSFPLKTLLDLQTTLTLITLKINLEEKISIQITLRSLKYDSL